MRVCLVSQEYPPDTVRGGVGVQTWNKARWLARLGHDVHVLSCAAGPGPELMTKAEHGVMVYRMQPPDTSFSVYETHTYWLGYSWSVLRHLYDLRERFSFEVIDFPDYGAEGFAYQLDRTRWNWTPVVVQLHAPLAMFTEHIGWPERDSHLHRIGTFMEGESIRRADALMACSANIADFTAGYYQLPRESIDVVHCGVDTEAFTPRECQREGHRPTVLFVGNLAANKGVHTTLEAVLRLRTAYPDIQLKIVGKGDGSEAEEIKSRARRAGAQGNVHLVGFVSRDRLPEQYQSADVFCSPASYEGGVANVYLEAMACACPVVASTAGGAPEAVEHGRTGLLVPPRDPAAVADAIGQVLRDRETRRRIGSAGRQRVEEYFAMEKYIHRVLSVYRKAIENAARKLEHMAPV